MSFAFPRAAYAARIGLDALPRTAPGSLARLRQLTAMHPQHIPFETIDALLQRPIPLDLRHICTKLLYAGRGGYCFEHCMLLEAALRDAGFAQVYTSLGRVLWGDGAIVEPTHALALVRCRDGDPDVAAALARAREHDDNDADGNGNSNTNKSSRRRVAGDAAPWWVADVGFGACLTQAPLLLDVRGPQYVPGGVFRVLRREAGEYGDAAVYTVQVRIAAGERDRNNNSDSSSRVQEDKTSTHLQTSSTAADTGSKGEKWKSMYCFTTRPQPLDALQHANDFVARKPVFSENIMGMSVRGTWLDDGVTYVQQRVCSLRNNVVTIKPGYSTTSLAAAAAAAHASGARDGGDSHTAADEAAAAAAAVAADLSTPLQRKYVHTCATPEEFYHHLQRHLGTRLEQTAYPEHTVTREEFCRVARDKLAEFARKVDASKMNNDEKSTAAKL